jgi:hypothetical protein
MSDVVAASYAAEAVQAIKRLPVQIAQQMERQGKHLEALGRQAAFGDPVHVGVRVGKDARLAELQADLRRRP